MSISEFSAYLSVVCAAQVLPVSAATERHQEWPFALLFCDSGPARLLRPAV